MCRIFFVAAALLPSVVLAADAQTHAMTRTEFVANTIEHLAWPAIVLLLIALIHPHLKALIDRILEFSFGGATVKFGQFLKPGTEIVDSAPRADFIHAMQDGASAASTPGAGHMPSGPERLDAVWPPASATAPPVQSIFHSFASVEDVLEDIGRRLNTKARNGALVRMLVQRDLASAECIELYDNLRNARNAVAHGQAAMPNEAESLEYKRQAIYLDAILRTLLQTLEQSNKTRFGENGPGRP